MNAINFIKKYKLTILFVILIWINFTPIPTNTRYEIEKATGTLDSFFYSCGVGVKDMPKDMQYYDEEQEYIDNETIMLNISKYSKPTVYLYGRIVNSAAPLSVICNGNVVDYEKHLSNSNLPMFWKHIYLDKYFVVELTNIKENSTNEIIITSGVASEKYYIKLN